MSLMMPNGTYTRPMPFRQGQAQPIQPQSQGTPYGQGGAFGGDGTWYPNEPVASRASGDTAAWGSQSAAQQANPGRQVQQGRTGWTVAGSGEPRQPPFTQTLNTPFGQMDPGQYYQQRDAFIQSANTQTGGYMPGGQQAGQAPQWNPQQMWGQAGQMVQRGWQNPMAQQQQPLIDIDSPFYGGGQQGGGWNDAMPYRPGGGAASRPMGREGLPGGGEANRRPGGESAPRAGGDPNTAWRQQQQAQINSPQNRSWLNSLSPANRQAYGLMQRMF